MRTAGRQEPGIENIAEPDNCAPPAADARDHTLLPAAAATDSSVSGPGHWFGYGEKPPKAQTSSSRFCSLKDASCAWARVATDSDPSWLTITAFRGRHRADLRIHGS